MCASKIGLTEIWTDETMTAKRRRRVQGSVVAVDLLAMEGIPGVTVVQGNFLYDSTQERVREELRPMLSDDWFAPPVNESAPSCDVVLS